MPNEIKASLPNRRKELRLPLHDLTLKIRKSGIGIQNYEPCRSVDLSINGLAFASETLTLRVSEKIDFILTVEAHEIRGAGVICNKRFTEDGIQYGLMFISVSPEISDIFDYGELSTPELESLSRNLAEQFVLSLIHSDDTQYKLILLKQQQLFDACRSYLVRLGEMGLRMSNANHEHLVPVRAIRMFLDRHGGVMLQWYNSFSHTAEQLNITLESRGLLCIFMIDGTPIKSVLQVLEVLGQRIKTELRFL